MNGLEFVQAMRADARNESVKVMMVTTETQIEQMVAALQAGVNEYVMKPFTREVIEDKLRILGVSCSLRRAEEPERTGPAARRHAVSATPGIAHKEPDVATLAKTILAPGARIRVLVVDDSVVIRRLVSLALGEEPLIDVVGSAANGSSPWPRSRRSIRTSSPWTSRCPRWTGWPRCGDPQSTPRCG